MVDNASTDGSRAWLESLGPRVRLIKNDENVGFGRANNQAFAATDAPLLFLLNNDAAVYPGTIDTLIETVRSSERIGVVGPRLLNPNGTLQPSVWRNPLTPFEMVSNTLRLYKLMPRGLRGSMLLGFHWDHATRRRARSLSGAALMVKRAVVNHAGGFDERFHMFGEDAEWSLRIVRHGWWMLFEPAAVVLHHGGQSSAKRWSGLEKTRIHYLSFFDFQRRCFSRPLFIANLITGYLLTLAQYPWRRMRSQPLNENQLVRKLYASELRSTLAGRRQETESGKEPVVKGVL